MTDRMMMTPEQRIEFRRALGRAVIGVQNEMQPQHHLNVLIPELIAALLSLAAYVAHENAHVSRARFDRSCRMAADEQWLRDPRDVGYSGPPLQ